jgi:hypothetical protein
MSDDDNVIKLADDEWADRFGWSSNEGKVSNLLEDTEDNRMLLSRIGIAYVWSQQDGEAGGFEIVPGMNDDAIGYYLCDKPRTTPDDERVIGIIPPIGH